MIERPTRIVHIFMGKGEFPGQLPLATRREAQHWNMFPHTNSRDYDALMRSVGQAIVVLNGADTGACIAFAVIDALIAQAKRAVVPLFQTMTYDEHDNPLVLRANRFIARLPLSVALDKRLIVLPTPLWKWTLARHIPHLRERDYPTYPRSSS